ncbi:MAG: hypothetical protein SGCHY_000719 [Lobulomycetales sp.]
MSSQSQDADDLASILTALRNRLEYEAAVEQVAQEEAAVREKFSELWDARQHHYLKLRQEKDARLEQIATQIKDADRSFKQTVAGFLQDMTLLDSAAADQDDQLELLDEVIR